MRENKRCSFDFVIIRRILRELYGESTGKARKLRNKNYKVLNVARFYVLETP